MIKVSLDGDDQTTVEIKKVDEMNSMDDLLAKCAKKFKVVIQQPMGSRR